MDQREKDLLVARTFAELKAAKDAFDAATALALNTETTRLAAVADHATKLAALEAAKAALLSAESAYAAAVATKTSATQADADADAALAAAAAAVTVAQKAHDDALAIVVDAPRAPMIYRHSLNRAAIVVLRLMVLTADRYQRFRTNVVLRKSGEIVQFHCINIAAGGRNELLAAAGYRLVFRPLVADTGLFGPEVELARTTVPVGSRYGNFTLSLAGVRDSLGTVQIQPIGPSLSESYPFTTVTINVSGGARDFPWYFESNDTYEWAHDPVCEQRYAVKSVAKDGPQVRPKPLDTTDWPSFGAGIVTGADAAKVINALTRINYCPPGFMYPPKRTLEGVTVTSGTQPYFMGGATDFQPYMPFRDGDYGVATTSHTLDVFFGRHHKVYFMSPYSARVVDTFGRMRTLCGYRHTALPEHADVMAYSAKGQLHPYVQVVGRWPVEIPLTQRKPRMCWGWFFVKSTTTAGTGTTPVQDPTMHGAEIPHDAAIVSYLLNGHGGRILRLVHDARDHTVEPIIQVAAVTGGLNVPTHGVAVSENHTDEFDIEDLEDGTYAVSERYMNRISRWRYKGPNATDEFVEYLVDGGVRPGNMVHAGAMKTLYGEAFLRSLPCACPEGLDYQDGWLYFGSSLAGQWRRVNVATKQIQLVCPERSARETQVVAFQGSVSDGTACPRGTLGHVDFDNQTSGPRFHLPRAGKDRRGDSYTHCDEYIYNTATGAWGDRALFPFEQPNHLQIVGVGPTLNGVYPLSIFIGSGGVAVGGTESWISAWRAPRAGEVMPDQARLSRGRQKWLNAGYEVEWGPYGEGASSKPYPEDADIRYWLTSGCGVVI